MSEALRIYGRVLSSALAILFILGIATVAMGIGVRSYAEALTPQVGGRPLARSRRRQVVNSWIEVLGMLAISAACYGYVCFKLASSYVSTLPAEQRSMTLTVATAAGMMIPYFGAVFSGRSDYLEFRRSTDFRVWIRGVRSNGLSAAHEHYFAGWRLRAFRELFSAVLIYTFVSASIAGLAKLATVKVVGRREWILIAVGFAALMTISLVRRVLAWFWGILRPEYRLADRCTNFVKRRVLVIGKAASRFRIYRPGEWRSRQHADSFTISNLLEWSVRRAQGRYAQHHYDELTLAARRLAQSLRLKALEITNEADGAKVAYEERKFLALQLATGRDPLEFTGRIAELTVDDPEPPELPRQRAARLIESISGGINVHWPAVKTIGIIVMLAWLIWSGKLMDAAGLLK